MEPQNPKEESKDSGNDRGKENRVYLNEIPLIGGRLVRRVVDFDSKGGLKASMMNKK